tara:strand:- start:1865 stop:2989 length:1125 start_codon:yes stop_codon:yes gene_type:complete
MSSSEICKSEEQLELLKNKTQKKKKNYSEYEKARLWSMFDKDIEKRINEKQDLNNEDMECIYNKGEQTLCSVCNNPLMVMENDFPTCTNKQCGIIYKKVLDFSPEWSFYGGEDKNGKDPARCGNPINPLLIESSFGCKVMTNGKSTFEMRKIKKWTEWQAMPHREKALNEEFQFITVMAHNAGIPKIFIDCAMIIHKDISEQKMLRGLNRDGIKAASIYISCRLNGCPRNAHEIAEIFLLDKASATNGCSMAVNILNNIERNLDPSLQTKLKDIQPIAFIERFACKLNFNKEMINLCKFIAKKIEQIDLIDNNIPHAVASGILYFVSQICKLNLGKKDIKLVCGVSEVTINKCYKKLESYKEKLVPKKVMDKYS